jgi:enoyl-CoA hydratase/carnithine racemase
MAMTPNQPAGRIDTESHDGVFRIVMNRPDKKNALTIAMYSALTEAVEQAEKDPAVRVILITGAGDCFTSGNDLRDFLDNPPRHESSPVFRFMAAIARAEKPVVAAVCGLAVGIGTTMLLHCDLVYAGTNARFLLPFVNLGLCPEAGSSLLLPLLAGHRRASEILLLGEMFSTEKAAEIGLVNSILEDSQVAAYALEQARKLAAKPQSSVRLTKSMLKKTNARMIEGTIYEEARLLIERVTSPEATEAFTAFFERRKPDFTNF